MTSSRSIPQRGSSFPRPRAETDKEALRPVHLGYPFHPSNYTAECPSGDSGLLLLRRYTDPLSADSDGHQARPDSPSHSTCFDSSPGIQVTPPAPPIPDSGCLIPHRMGRDCHHDFRPIAYREGNVRPCRLHFSLLFSSS